MEKLVIEILDNFFKKRLEILQTFRLRGLVLNQNPYLLMIDGKELAGEIVEDLMRTHMNAQDNTLFREMFSEAIAQFESGAKVHHDQIMSIINNASTEHIDEYALAWDATLNLLTEEFVRDFCLPQGGIEWGKLARFVSQDNTKA